MKMMKRVLSLLMCFVMVAGMLPLDVLSVSMGEDGTPVYQIGDSVWVRGEEAEPTEVCAPDTFWLPVYDDNDQPVTRQGLCEKTEHTHHFVCPEDCQLAHTHGEDCYTQEYTGCTIHTHDENCVRESVYTCGKELHENHDSCTASQKCILEEHDHAALNCPTEVRFTCTEEHEHSLEAQCAHETVYTCGKENHAHGEAGCELVTVYDCGKEIHTHEGCSTEEVYTGCVEHAEHNENCTTEQKLSCGKDEHTCVTEGCAADCAIEEHTHTEECDMEGVYYKWTVVEDTSSTLENERGLPLHFFIAEPGEAIDPDGSYVNYKQSEWGSNRDSDFSGAYANITQTEINEGDFAQIATKNGIRNVSDEGLITPYIYKLPNGYDSMAAFKDFGSMTIRGKTYYDTEYEIKWVTICYRNNGSLRCYCGVNYNHIHIDGVLSKKILPAEMKLTKVIPDNQINPDNQETFNFKLTKLQHTSAGDATQNVDTSFGTNGSITLTATIPAGQTSASIVSPTGTTINFGYYMLEEMDNDRWQTSGIVIDRTGSSQNMNLAPGPVFVYIAPDGTLKYSSTYNGTYATADEIFVNNERKPLNVTYTWEGLPNGLAPLPEESTVTPGGTHAINTSYPIGTRVRGTGTNAGKYYEFMGWQHYDQDGKRQYITYENGEMDPVSITVNSDTNIHGLWVEHNLPTASGYITITKTFVNKPADATFSNFYISVLHEDHRTDISPALVGTWNADRTQWTYHFDISKSGTYTIVEGKYDVAGYEVGKAVQVVPVAGIGAAGDLAASNNTTIVSDGHSYTEFGQAVTVTLPYDTSVVSGAAGQAEGAFFHAATVNFTNTYTKKTQNADPDYPDLRVRKWDGEFRNTLNLENVTYAVFTLTNDETNTAIDRTRADGDTYIYEDLTPGTYTLKETKAPEGYIADTTEYAVHVVESGDPVETLKLTCNSTAADHVHTTACYSFVTVQTYTIQVPGADGETLPGAFNPDPQVLRLNIPNEQIKADLNLVKTFTTENASFKPTAGSILVDIYGPVVKDSEGNVTDVGPAARTGLAINAPDWTLTVEGLPYGDYFVEEIMGSVHGYTWTGATFNGKDRVKVGDHYGAVVKVGSTAAIDLNIVNKYDVWTSADFFILKEDLGGNELSGAKFELFDESGANVTSIYLDDAYSANGLTNSSGLVHFVGFTASAEAPRTFTLKETVAPDGYYLTTNEYQVKVTYDGAYDIVITNSDGTSTGAWNHDDDLLTVVDTPILGQITVKKDFEFLNQLFNTVPEGTYVTFLLESKDGTFSRSASLTKDTGWSHTFKDLPLGEYTITELYASIDGHTYTTTHKVGTGTTTNGAVATVKLSAGTNHAQASGLPETASATVSFENTYKRTENLKVTPTSFTVLKQGENGEALPKATFTLFTDAACKNKLTAPVEGFTVEATTDAYGQAHFTGLKLPDLDFEDYKQGETRSATYYLKETVAPANHVLSDKVWTVTISENQIKINVLNDNKSAFDTVIEWITGIINPDGTSAISGNVLTVTNQRIKGDLFITKTFKDDQGQELDEEVTKYARAEIHVHGPITRNAQNEITDIGDLVANINLSGTNKTATVEDLEIGEYVLREPFASIHGYEWTNVSSGSGVTEAEFNGMKFAAFTVDANTPNISIDITNTYKKWEAADFYVNKVKSLDNLTDGLAGAKFKLYTDEECKNPATGSFTTEAETGIAGYAHFTGFTVPAGDADGIVTYYLKEVTAPDNYKMVDTVWKVTITHDNNSYDVTVGLVDGAIADGTWTWNHELDVLNVKNEEILGSITITKEFPGEQPVQSVNVRVIGPNGYSRDVELHPDSQNSENNWKAKLDGLHMGTYYIVEQDPSVSGYTLTTTYYEGTELEGGTTNPAAYATVVLDDVNKVAPNVAVKILNNYSKQVKVVTIPTSFTIQKLDGDDKTTPLQYAKFKLTDEQGTQVGNTWETGPDGKVTISDLELTELQYEAYLNLTQERSVKYYLSEVEAPEGYKKTDMVWEITLTEHRVQIEVVDPADSFFTAIYEWLLSVIGKQNNDGKSDTTLGDDGILTVYNDRIKGDLTITKKFNGVADPSKARVEIHVHGPIKRENGQITDIGPLVKAITLPDTDGKLVDVVKDLEIGEYVLREPFASIHGYTWTGVTYSGITTEKFNNMDFAAFTVDAETPDISIDVTNTYEEWTSADFYVNKVKTLDNLTDGLAGAKFKLYTDEACTTEATGTFTTEAETGIAGYAHFTGFTVPDGETSVTYYLKEAKAPANYHPVNTVWKVEIKAVTNGGKTTYEPKITLLTDTTGEITKVDGAWSWNRENDTLNVVNQPILANLTIQKKFDNDIIPEGIGSIVVNLVGPNVDKEILLNADNSWTVTETGLALGTYTVTEDAAAAKVDGYDLVSTTYKLDQQSGTNTIVFDDNDYVEAVTITNSYNRKVGVANNPDQFTIYKTDENGKALSGAKFRLTNDHNPTQVRDFVTGADGKVVVDNLIGIGTLTSSTNVTYTLEEIEAPTGHELSGNRTWTISVVEDGPENGVQVYVELNVQNDTYETIWDWIIGQIDPDQGYQDKTLTVVNNRKSAPVSVTKAVVIDGLTDAENDEYVEDLADVAYEFELYIDGRKVETVKVKAGETETFKEKVPYGSTYEVKEVSSDKDAFTSNLTGAAGTIGVNELSGIEVKATNTYTFQSGDALTLNMTKVSTGKKATPLSGAMFTLYDSNGKVVDIYKSDKNGKFRIAEIDAPGTYSLKETAAPSGYEKLDKPITITAAYDYEVVKVDGKPVVVRTLVATVAGKTVYEISDNSYGVKNTPITETPKTGDDTDLLLWGGMTTVSLMGMAMLFLFFPRKKGKYQR